MTDLEQENATYRETLAQVQGEMNLLWDNMEAIVKYLQTQRAATSSSPATAPITNVAVVTTTADAIATVETLVETVVLIVVNQPLFTSASNRLASAYP